MPSQKKPAANVLQQGGHDSPASRSSTAPALRRSSRRIGSIISDTATTASKTSGRTTRPEKEKIDLKPDPPKRKRRVSQRVMDSSIDSPSESDTPTVVLRDRIKADAEGVRFAIEGLVRMERRLQRAVKRQKLQVEESVAVIEADTKTENAFKPRPTRYLRATSSRDIAVNAAADPLPTPERNTVESEFEDDAAAEGVPQKSRGDSNAAAVDPPSMVERGGARAPPVNSAYLPLPWRGRLGYACLNTYLRTAHPPVFSSRTCRMSSIIDHRYALRDPSKPEHPSHNRPDRSKSADVALGRRFVQELGLANARDVVKTLRWNERYGIRFFRLSSEMFPFASHPEHGYKLASFASDVLANVGRVAAELGHRLTTHPGQFTQLGSPRPEVIESSVRDLEYHDEMLSLLHLPPQQDRDAVMILHMGGVYGDKAAAVERFRNNYNTLLSDSIKKRLVLENDDVSWSVHDLLPICEELNIPLVLDFHHHNIVFDAAEIREGTADLEDLIPRIKKTWERKGVTMKMHYSEPCAGAVTPRDRRRHSPRVATLPPCPPDVDLMIEAKDKEQAVFELMRNFRLPGFERVRDMIPYERTDEPTHPQPAASTAKGASAAKKSAGAATAAAGGGGGKKGKGKQKRQVMSPPGDVDQGDIEMDGEGERSDREAGAATLAAKNRLSSKDAAAAAASEKMPEEEIGMGGPEGRVYWPPGMEEWLRPRKRDQKRKAELELEED